MIMDRIHRVDPDMPPLPADVSPHLEEALYRLVCAGFRGDEALNLAHWAVDCSLGWTTPMDLSELLAAVLNAYHLPSFRGIVVIAHARESGLSSAGLRNLLDCLPLAAALDIEFRALCQAGAALERIGVPVRALRTALWEKARRR